MKPFKILFLCEGNANRSIMAEYIIRRLDPRRFESYSAGTHPVGHVNPFAIEALRQNYRIDASQARSKSWKEYENVPFQFIIALSESAWELAKNWPGQPIAAYWETPDPDTFTGDPKEKYFQLNQTLLQINRRLSIFTSLPFEDLSHSSMRDRLQQMGTDHAAPKAGSPAPARV